MSRVHEADDIIAAITAVANVSSDEDTAAEQLRNLSRVVGSREPHRNGAAYGANLSEHMRAMLHEADMQLEALMCTSDTSAAMSTGTV